MEELISLLREKEELRLDNSIGEDEYYDLIELIDNKIINDYTSEEIEKAEQFLNEEEVE